jgi:putative aldouronate transport system permease protein
MGGIIVAFKSYNYRKGILFSDWIGFDNFRYFFTSGKALQVTVNTLGYNLVFLACLTFFSILVALLVAEVAGRVYKKVCHTLMFLPYFISWVTASALMYNFFNYEFGLVNTILRSLGKEALDIYSEPAYWYFILPFLHVWKWVGFGSILYLASIMSIDQEQYESATIDGANSFQKIKYITIPSIVPTMVILLLLNLGQIFRGQFDMFYQLIGNNGLLMDATDIIDTLVFRSLVGTHDFGMTSSAGFYQSILCFLIIVSVNWVIKKRQPDYALF